MEKKILVYDDNGTESEEFCTMLAQGFETLPTVIGIFICMVFMAGFFMARRKRKDIAIGGDKNE